MVFWCGFQVIDPIVACIPSLLAVIVSPINYSSPLLYMSDQKPIVLYWFWYMMGKIEYRTYSIYRSIFAHQRFGVLDPGDSPLDSRATS